MSLIRKISCFLSLVFAAVILSPKRFTTANMDFLALTEMSDAENAEHAQYREVAQKRLSVNLNKLVQNNTSITAADVSAILTEIQFSDVVRDKTNPNFVPGGRRGTLGNDNNTDEMEDEEEDGYRQLQQRPMLSTSRFSRPSPTTMRVGKASATVEAATVRMCRSAGGNPRTAPELLRKLRGVDLSQINNADIRRAHETFVLFEKVQKFDLAGNDDVNVENAKTTILAVEEEDKQFSVRNVGAKDVEEETDDDELRQAFQRRSRRASGGGILSLISNAFGTKKPQQQQGCLPDAPAFRSADGSNNNLKRRQWGKQNAIMKRSFNIGPHYDGDCGVKDPRIHAYAFDASYRNIFSDKPSFSNRLLPNPRAVTNTLMNAGQLGVKDNDLTHMVMQYGQFLDHDLTLTPLYGAADGQSDLPLSQSCVSKNKCINHPECFCICNTGDPARNKTCLDFRRSAAGQTSLGDKREQINELTPFVDGGNVYGASDVETRELRARSPVDVGLLKVSFSPNSKKEQLPRETDVDAPGRTDGCRPKSTTCFAAGDTRVNTHVGLASMHTLWVREHNRIARALHAINPKWNGERVFQETRRIVVAMLQHITYRHWLPVVLGDATMRAFGLTVRDGTLEYECQNYDPELEAGTLSEFCTTAFRFGHTLVDNEFSLRRQHAFGRDQHIRISDSYFDMSMFKRDAGTCDAVLGGLSHDGEQKFDNVVANVLRNELFRSDTFAGHDLPARNIQRGRDHGQPGYAFFAWACQQRYGENLGRTLYPNLRNKISPTSEAFKMGQIQFNELPLRPSASKLLQRAYSGFSAADIDLFAAGVSEVPVGETTGGNGILGPTFACIIAEQFRMAKRGDRFFYTNPTIDANGRANNEQCEGANAFNPCQLQELSRMSMAHVMCATEAVQTTQRDVFRQISRSSNPSISCDKLEKLDLSAWRDGAQCNKPTKCQ